MGPGLATEVRALVLHAQRVDVIDVGEIRRPAVKAEVTFGNLKRTRNG